MAFYIHIKTFYSSVPSKEYFINECDFPVLKHDELTNKKILRDFILGDDVADLNDGSDEESGCKKHCVCVSPWKCQHCDKFGPGFKHDECPIGCGNRIEKLNKNFDDFNELDLVISEVVIDFDS
jgi:hypothetical protein